MGMLALNRLMSMKRDKQRRRRQILSRCGLSASSTGKRKGSPWEQDGHGDSQASKITRSSIPDLPEDILFRIHCLMPMREAARAACVSRAFLHSWRCHPNLIFNKDIGLKKNGRGENFHHKIDRILRNHSGISLKTFKLDYSGMCGFDGTSYLDSWLQIALKPGIEELTLWLSETNRKYNFPCSLLADGVGNSLQYLKLRCCALCPTVELGPPLRSLTSLHLWHVSITWDELKCLLSNSLALEQLELVHCVEITCLKIPCSLQRLSSLTVFECSDMNVIESKAPNLSSLFLRGHRLIFSRVETLQMKKLDILRSNFIRDARANLPSLMPNLETLVINSGREVVDVPMLPTKFLYLKHLTIWLMFGPTSRPYDYFSLVSFIDASPSLETLVLDVSQLYMVHESICADSQLRHVPEHRHACLKSVKISGFSSAKSLFELVYYIVKNAVSLECLTLDTIYGHRCDEGKYKRCIPMSDELLMETPRALAAIRTYIKNKVPSTVKLTVLEPCSRCHATGRWRILSQSGNAISM